MNLPKDWRDGLLYAKRLYNLHADTFGKEWTEELVPIADRFRKYLVPLEKAEDENYLTVNRISLGDCSDADGRAERIAKQDVLLERTPKKVARFLWKLRNGVRRHGYKVLYTPCVNMMYVAAWPETIEYAPVVGIALSWSEGPRAGQVQMHDRLEHATVSGDGEWWGPERRLPFDPHLGLMLAAGLSRKQTVARWPKKMKLRDDGPSQPIGPAQTLMMTLLRKNEIIRSDFFQALRERVSGCKIGDS
ncbi:hypothetical protein HY285_02660 [Candidatus Peregrinibacteria bacterium]|nr:hypothetical protein [Candidatus Peregrinibacteria bacterium]MBI3816422.1 hypothetical protein [Candidatus Peregrinibacteria bacterium]